MMKICCMVYEHNYKTTVQVAHGERIRERTSGRRNKTLKSYQNESTLNTDILILC